MDVLSAILRTLEVRGSVFCFGPVGAPWRFEGGAEGRCLFHAVVEGSAWMSPAVGEPVRLADPLHLEYMAPLRCGGNALFPAQYRPVHGESRIAPSGD